jgi:hypothetical protein
MCSIGEAVKCSLVHCVLHELHSSVIVQPFAVSQGYSLLELHA